MDVATPTAQRLLPPPAPTAVRLAPISPVLPQAPARMAPTFERRTVEIDVRRIRRRSAASRRGRRYVTVALIFAVLSAAGYVGFREYIYSDEPAPVPAPRVIEVTP